MLRERAAGTVVGRACAFTSRVPSHCLITAIGRAATSSIRTPNARWNACADARVVARAPAFAGSRWHFCHAEGVGWRRARLARREGAPRTHLRCYPLLRGRAGVVGASRAHAAPRVLVLVGGPQPSCYLRQGSLIFQEMRSRTHFYSTPLYSIKSWSRTRRRRPYTRTTGLSQRASAATTRPHRGGWGDFQRPAPRLHAPVTFDCSRTHKCT